MNETAWKIDETDPMIIKVWHSRAAYEHNQPADIKIFLGEAMEEAGREAVMKYIAEIERSPWVRNWHSQHTWKMLKKTYK